MDYPIKELKTYITLEEAEKTYPGCTAAFEQHILYEISVLSDYRDTPFTAEDIRKAYRFFIDRDDDRSIHDGILTGEYASFNHVSSADRNLLENSDPVIYWGPKDGWSE